MIPFLHLPPSLLEATHNLAQVLEANPLVEPVWVLVPLHRVYSALLVYFYGQPHATQLDPFNAFLMLAHWHQDGHFSSPHHITPNIAAQQWGGQAFFLMEMLRLSQQGIPEHKGFFGWVIRLCTCGNMLTMTWLVWPHHESCSLWRLGTPHMFRAMVMTKVVQVEFSSRLFQTLNGVCMALTQVPRACDMLKEYMREERPSPMHTLYLQMALLSHVASKVTHFPWFM